MTSESVIENIRRSLPESVKNILRPVARQFRKVNISPPVAQMYICDNDIDTILGINNFWSIMAPEKVTCSRLILQVYGSKGEKIGTVTRRLADRAGLSLKVSDILKELNKSSQLGLISLQIIPDQRRAAEYLELGTATSHFFAFYFSQQGSFGHVHPSSILDPENSSRGDFISNQMIATKGLEKVKLYQVNPSYHSCLIKHSLVSPDHKEGEKPFLECTRTLLPFETASIELNMPPAEQTAIPNFLVLKVEPLPSANSKPLLFRYYSNNRFSMSHS